MEDRRASRQRGVMLLHLRKFRLSSFWQAIRCAKPLSVTLSEETAKFLRLEEKQEKALSEPHHQLHYKQPVQSHP